MENEEKILDKKQWEVEAEGVMRDVEEHVREVCLSSLQNSDSFIYFNVTTEEGNKYCVELSAAGFRIVGNSYDSKVISEGQYFETPYALLDSISANYRTSFLNCLQRKIESLENSIPDV